MNSIVDLHTVYGQVMSSNHGVQLPDIISQPDPAAIIGGLILMAIACAGGGVASAAVKKASESKASLPTKTRGAVGRKRYRRGELKREKVSPGIYQYVHRFTGKVVYKGNAQQIVDFEDENIAGF